MGDLVQKPVPLQVDTARKPRLRTVTILAREFTEEAINTLVDLMRNAPSHNVRLSAAEALLDRAWGRPAQSVRVSEEPTTTPTHFETSPVDTFFALIEAQAKKYSDEFSDEHLDGDSTDE